MVAFAKHALAYGAYVALIANHPGDLQPRRCAQGSVLHGHGGCDTLRCHLLEHRLLCIRDQPRRRDGNRLAHEREVGGIAASRHRADPSRLRCCGKLFQIPQLTVYLQANVIMPAPLLPRRHPLGFRMGAIRRLNGLPTLLHRRNQHRRRLAHVTPPHRIRPHHPIHRLQLPLLHRRAGQNARLGTTVVWCISFRSDVYCRGQYCD